MAILPSTMPTAKHSTGTTHDEDTDTEMDRMSWVQWFLYLTTLNWEDVLMILNEKIELIDWDQIASEIAELLGHFLTLSLYLIKYFQDNFIKPNHSRIYNKRIETIFDFNKSATLKKYKLLEKIDNIKLNGLLPHDKTIYYKFLRLSDSVVQFLNLILVISNVYTCYKFFFGYFRCYSLFYINEVSNKTTHVEKKLLSNLKHDFNDILNEQSDNQDNSFLTKVYNFFFENKKAKEPHVINNKDYYFELTKWVPTKFITHLFMSFSPTVLIILLFTNVTFLTFLAILINQYIFHFLIKNYNLRIIDDNILSSATMDEYQLKVTKPRWTRKYQPLSVDIDKDHSNQMVNFSKAPIRNGIFETHSLNGELIKEKYNFNEQTFERLQNTEYLSDRNVNNQSNKNRNINNRFRTWSYNNDNDKRENFLYPPLKPQFNHFASLGRSTPSIVSIPINSSANEKNNGLYQANDFNNDVNHNFIPIEKNSKRNTSKKPPFAYDNMIKSNVHRRNKRSSSPLRNSIIYDTSESHD